MNTRTFDFPILSAFALLSSLFLANAAPPAKAADQPVNAATRAERDELADATAHINKAEQVVRRMTAQPEIKQMMQRARGIYVVPDYGRAAAVVGGQGGAGVLMVKHDGKWLGPAFYNLGSISIGAQAGITAGSIALLLMNDKAVRSFGASNNFSLDANAGITIVNYSAKAQGSAGKGDVVLWSDTEGAFAGAAIAASDIVFDKDETAALYKRSVAPGDVLAGKLPPPSSAQTLVQAIAAR